MNLRLLAAATLLPLTLASCKLLQLPLNLVRTVTGGIVENTPSVPTGAEAGAGQSAVALKHDSLLPFAPPTPARTPVQ